MNAEDKKKLMSDAARKPLATCVGRKLGHLVGIPPGLRDYRDPLFDILPGSVQVAVEIGTCQGWFAHRMAKFLSETASIFCIDPFEDDAAEGYDGEYNLKCWKQNTREWFGKKVFLKRGTSWDEGKAWGDGVKIDFLFIDGDHSFEAVLLDLKMWVPKVRPGGMVMGHDITGPHGPAVKKAIEAYAEEVKGLPDVRVQKIYSYTGRQVTECFWWLNA